MTITVTILYKLKSGESHSIEVAPSAYFDQWELEEGQLCVESLPKHEHADEHLRENLGLSNDCLASTTVMVIDSTSEKKRISRELFLARNDDRIIDNVLVEKSGEYYRDIIVHITGRIPSVTRIVRVRAIGEYLELLHDSEIEDLPDGSVREVHLGVRDGGSSHRED